MKKMMPALLSMCLLLVLTACGSGPADGGGTEAIVDDTVADATQPTADAGPTKSEAVSGTNQNPVPLGLEASVGSNWNVAILEMIPDAWPTIEQAFPEADPPRDGHQFVIATVRMSNVGDKSGTSWVEIGFQYLGSDGHIYGDSLDDYCGMVPDALPNQDEQSPGTSVEGKLCWSIPKDAIAGGSIIAVDSFSFVDTQVFFVAAR